MVTSLKERTKETNVGLVKPFARREVTYTPNIQMHVNGKFRNADFRNSLEKNIPKFMPIELADKKPLFRYTQPRELTSTQRSGYEFGRGLKALENDIAEANAYKEYVGAQTLQDVKHSAPTGAMMDMAVGPVYEPQQPAPHSTNADASSLSISNNQGGSGSSQGDMKMSEMVVDMLGRSRSRIGESIKAYDTEMTEVSGTPGVTAGMEGVSNAISFTEMQNRPESIPLTDEAPRRNEALAHARATRRRDPQSAPSGTFTHQMDQLADAMEKKLKINLNRRPVIDPATYADRQPYKTLVTATGKKRKVVKERVKKKKKVVK